jgi:tetratricopeptide (TPR) repeat protein
VPDPNPSIEQLLEQLRQAELAGDPWRQGIALNNLGSHYKDRRDTGKAVGYFQRALEFFTALDDREKKATVLTNLGGTFLDCRDYAPALEKFALALGTYGSLNQPFGQAMALNNMGGVHLLLHRYEDARKQFILAASFFRSAQTPAWEAQALENLAAAEAGAGNSKAAVESYGRALEIWQHQNQHDRQAMILNRLAVLHLSSGDTRRSLELHSRALALAQKANSVPLVAATRASLGRLYFDARNFNAARTEFQAALLSCEQLGDKRGQANALLSLGKIDLATGHELIANAARLFREAGDSEGEKAALKTLTGQEEEPAKVKNKPA